VQPPLVVGRKRVASTDGLAAVRDGAPLARIESIKDGMVTCVRRGLFEILKVQGITLAVVLVTGPALLRLTGVSPLYLRLLLRGRG
jgi:uncharacterized membrane protein